MDNSEFSNTQYLLWNEGPQSMKKIILNTLRYVRLAGLAKRIKNELFPSDFYKAYGQRKEYLLDLSKIQVKYTTEDDYSKGWFFPRYDNGKYHEPVITNLFVDELKPTSCVLDIGANLGYFTCLAGKLCTEGEVHAFEIDKKCFPILIRNVEINDLTNVTLTNVAVSDNNDFEMIPENIRPKPALSITNAKTGKLKSVSALTIDSYIDQKKIIPDIVKIDVEGAEFKVLSGMQHTLKQSDLILFIEVHVQDLVALNSSYHEVLQMLLGYGFQLKEIQTHKSSEVRYRDIDEKSVLQGNTMLLATKSSDRGY